MGKNLLWLLLFSGHLSLRIFISFKFYMYFRVWYVQVNVDAWEASRGFQVPGS